MYRFVPAAGLLMLAASASSGTSSAELTQSRTASQSIMASGGMANLAVRNETTANSAALELTPDQAFTALEAAYVALSIPIAEKYPSKRQLGNPSFRVRRKLGDLQLIRLVDCGGDSGMPNAETYIVTLSITSVIIPGATGGSVVQTVLDGDAKNPLTNAASNVRCASQGELEKAIVAKLKAAAAK